MKALWVDRLSPDLSGLSYKECKTPRRRPGEVLVRIHAGSLNFPDLLMTRGAYQFKPTPPFIAGMEMAGEVVEGDPDCAFPIGARVMGGAKTGSFAEYVSLPSAQLRPIPDALDYRQAACLGAAYSTAYTALVELGGLEAGQWVLIHGASGGVGLAAVDLAKSLGAKVIASSASSDKLERISALYAPDAVIKAEGRFREAVADITQGVLCDLVLDPVGGDIFDESTRCTAFGGKLLVVGFAGGRIAEIASNIPLIKGFSVVGVRAGEYARRFPERGAHIAAKLAAMVNEGRIAPAIDRVLPLSQWRDGFTAMQNRELVGKIVLEPEQSA